MFDRDNEDEEEEYYNIRRDEYFIRVVLRQLKDIQSNTHTLLKAIKLLGEAIDDQSKVIEKLQQNLRDGLT